MTIIIDIDANIKKLSKKQLIDLWHHNSSTLNIVKEKYGEKWDKEPKQKLVELAIVYQYMFDIMGESMNTFSQSLL